MKVLLSTQPDFLRSRLSPVRSYLSGTVVLPREQVAGQPLEGIIFQAPSQPNLLLTSEPVEQSAPTLEIPVWPVLPEVSVEPVVSAVPPVLQTKVQTPAQVRPVQAKPRWEVGLPLKKLRTFGLTLLAVLAVVVSVGVFLPYAYFKLVPVDVVPVTAQTDSSPMGGEFAQGTATQPQKYQPPRDETLPTGEWLVIPRIGVRTELQNTPDSEAALAKGVWLVPDFGKPGETDLPMILAAHRYGWQWWWQSDYWKYHSFYLLPELEPGDTVEVIADQRKWVYEVYAGEEGDEITDYQADLILYTCKFLNSPVRHFRYARLIDPTQNTQG